MKTSKKQSKQTWLSESGLLQVLDQYRSGYIDIEDMVKPSQKALVGQIPLRQREIVGGVLRAYVFENKSFNMPVADFLKAYREPMGKRQHRSSVANNPFDQGQPKPILKYSADSTTPRVRYSVKELNEFYSIEDSEVKSRVSFAETPQRRSHSRKHKSVFSASVGRDNKKPTYSRIYKKKKRDSAVPEGTLGRTFLTAYKDLNSILAIRKKHLELSRGRQ